MSYAMWCERPKTGEIWQLAVVGDVTVNRQKNEPASLSATILRDRMTVERGDTVAVQMKHEPGGEGFNVFYGYVYKTSKSNDEVTITAYDQLYSLKLTKEFRLYGDITVSELIYRVCQERGLYFADPPHMQDTTKVLPHIVCDNQTLLDLIIDKLNETFEQTELEYYLYDNYRDVCLDTLLDQRVLPEEFEVNTGTVETYSYDEDQTKTVNEVIIYSPTSEKEYQNDVYAVVRDKESIQEFGKITMTDKSEDKENAEQMAANLLNANHLAVPELNVTCWYAYPAIFPGRLIHVDFYTKRREYIQGWFRVDTVGITLSEGSSKMDLKLSLYEMENEAFE